MKNMVKTRRKIIIAAMVVCMLSVSWVIITNLLGVSFAKNNIKLYGEVKTGNAMYEVINQSDLLVEYMYPVKKTVTVSIPDVIKVKGKTLKVASIKAGAFDGNKKVKKITIGSKVALIGKNAFYRCKNLKDITIKASNLKANGVKANAFKGINSKAVIKVPEQKLSEYKKILKARGVTGKNQEIKGMKAEEEVPEVTFGPDHPLPEPKEAICSIGNIAKSSAATINKSKVSETWKYTKGDSIRFSARIYMTPEIYGQPGYRMAYGRWIMCYQCKNFFASDQDYAIHLCMSPKCGYHFLFPEQDEVYTEMYWIPDDEPCKVVFRFTLPEGLSCKEDSIEVLKSKYVEFPGISADVKKVDSNAYNVEISDQELTVTIDDIKTEPFFSYDFQELIDSGTPGALAYKWMEAPSYRAPFTIMFNAEMNDNTAAVNIVNASVSYSYKGMEKAVDLGNLNVYASSLQIKNTDASGNAITGSKFTLYKKKKVYNNTNVNIATLQYFEVAEAESIDGLLTFNGIGEGKYKLVQTEVPAGYKKMDSLIFDVSMKCENGSISSLSVKNQLGKKLSWGVNTKTGIIIAIQ